MDICRLTSDQPDSIKMVEIDFQALCRICGALGENLTSVFGKRAADRLRERVEKHFQIEILPDDCFPTKICDGCRETLDHFHELFEKCHRTEEKFRAMASATDEGKEAEQGAIEVPDGSPNGDDLVEEELEVVKNIPKELSRDTQKADERTTERTRVHFRHSIDIAVLKEDENNANSDFEVHEDFHGQYEIVEVKTEQESSIPKRNRARRIPLSKELIETSEILKNGDKVQYVCAVCGKVMNSPYTYQAHQRIHSGERPFACSQCPQTFRISQGLNRHVREVHEKLRTYPCDVCGKLFGNSQNLSEHKNLHTNERPYCCVQCGKSFNQRAALFAHNQTHKAQRKFGCSVCSRGFLTKSKLQLHETTHLEERAHQCSQCDQRFRSTHDLARHRKSHSNERPFRCAVCGILFKQRRYLIKHCKSLHPGKNIEECELRDATAD